VICDEINGRSEFLTAYAGEPYEDQGRFQALFEYQSLMAELLDVDIVNIPNFNGSAEDLKSPVITTFPWACPSSRYCRASETSLNG
jgi:hypothetical protein